MDYHTVVVVVAHTAVEDVAAPEGARLRASQSEGAIDDLQLERQRQMDAIDCLPLGAEPAVDHTLVEDVEKELEEDNLTVCSIVVHLRKGGTSHSKDCTAAAAVVAVVDNTLQEQYNLYFHYHHHLLAKNLH